MTIKIIFSKKCLDYGIQSDLLESSYRVEKAQEILKNKGFDFVEPKPAHEDEVLKVHSSSYLEELREGKLDENDDTPPYEGINEFARLSAGGAILSSEINGFSLMRPPGHHVGRNGFALDFDKRGFCYLNNIAIAVKHLDTPTLILDIDGHHGNGTQEVFSNDEKVVYASLHRGNFYPWTGIKSEGNCLNFPLTKDCGPEKYLKTLDKALDELKKFEFERVAVSAGFDTHIGDLASLGLIEETYGEIGRRIASLGRPTFFVLEGGYMAEYLGKDIVSLLRGFE